MHKKCKKELWKQVLLLVYKKKDFNFHRLPTSYRVVPNRIWLFQLISLVAPKSVEKKLIYNEVTTQYQGAVEIHSGTKYHSRFLH